MSLPVQITCGKTGSDLLASRGCIESSIPVAPAATFFCSCQYAAQTRIRPLQTTAQTSEQAGARAYLNVAYLKDRETTPLSDCDCPRFEDISPPQLLEVGACRLFIQSSADDRIGVHFVGDQSWIAAVNGIRQAGAEALKSLN